MIIIHIPGVQELILKNLLLDFNGTLALDGIILPGVKELLAKLAEVLDITIITADTFGTVKEELSGLKCRIVICETRRQREQKLDFLNMLNPATTCAIGNGSNDVLMLEKSALGICIIGHEGCSADALAKARVVCNNICKALELLLNHDRLKATLRV
jgi:P-type E1-E2 ATPase